MADFVDSIASHLQNVELALSFLDHFNGTVIQIVQDRNILSSLGESFFVDADPWKKRWFRSSFSTSNGTFDVMRNHIPVESQNCHGTFDGLSHKSDFDSKPLKHEHGATMRQSPWYCLGLFSMLGMIEASKIILALRTAELCTSRVLAPH